MGTAEDENDQGTPRTRQRQVLKHLATMTGVAAVLGVLVAGLAMPVVGLVGGTAKNAAETMEDLPLDLETRPLAEKTNVVDAEGKLIASFYDENRVNVSLDQISKPMLQAIVAIEDYRFYQHGAIDLKGTLRALITNRANAGTVQGGSSITQQMVKLTLVDQAETPEERKAATDDTYARKIRELRYAIAFEQNYSKDWILERYLNIAYFGDGTYGVQAAARHYFNKNASKLTVREAATLAGLVKNPVGYDPTSYPDRALARRNLVLERMAQLNVIPRDEAVKLKQKKLGLDVQTSVNGCVNSPAAFFCDYVYRYLLEDESLGKTRDERKDLLRSGGLTIRTTVDMKHQKAADASVRKHVYPTDQAIGALAMIEPGTGEVKALAQSRPMGDKKKRGQTYLNFLVPEKYGDSAGFQGGSTFKAFVMAAALQTKKVSPTKSYNAPSSISISQRDFEMCDGKPYAKSGYWTLSNSTSSGSMNMYTGTRLSVNTYYAQVTRDVGLCTPYKLAQKMGIQLDNPFGGVDHAGAEMTPTFGLGTPNTSPLELAEAYATFAARGIHCDSRPVTAIEDAEGNVLKSYPKTCDRVLRTDVADTANDVLRGVMEPGGFGSALALRSESAGKTGTSQSNRSVWFSGYTPDLAAVAMIAGANSFGHPISLAGQTIGGRRLASASGSGNAGPIWGDAMKEIQDSLKGTKFTLPPGGRYSAKPPSTPSSTSTSRPDGDSTQRGNERTERRGNDGGNDRGNGEGRGQGGGRDGGRGDRR